MSNLQWFLNFLWHMSPNWFIKVGKETQIFHDNDSDTDFILINWRVQCWDDITVYIYCILACVWETNMERTWKEQQEQTKEE